MIVFGKCYKQFLIILLCSNSFRTFLVQSLLTKIRTLKLLFVRRFILIFLIFKILIFIIVLVWTQFLNSFYLFSSQGWILFGWWYLIFFIVLIWFLRYFLKLFVLYLLMKSFLLIIIMTFLSSWALPCRDNFYHLIFT
jgi:hypothetical protein